MSEIPVSKDKFFDFSSLSSLSPVKEDKTPSESKDTSEKGTNNDIPEFFFDLTADEQDTLVKKGHEAAIEESAKRGDILAQKSAEKIEDETESDAENDEDEEPKSEYEKQNTQLDLFFGPFIVGLMRRDDVNEIYINDDGFVWYDSYREGKVKSKERIAPAKARSIIELVAGQRGKVANEDVPSLSAEISGYGARFQGELPPIVRNPQFNIRKKAIQIFTLDDYVRQGVLSQHHCDFIKQSIIERKNILVVGGTGTGKTTLLNAVLDAIATLTPFHRIISLEDLPELQCSAPDYSPMFTKQETGKAGVLRYNMTRLLADCMRRSPDRIIVGEVRDGAAYSMLKAWNTGHPGGACTVHANNSVQGLTRIKSLAEEDEDATGDLKDLIGEAIDVVLCINHTDLGNGKKGRIIRDIIAVDSYDDEKQKYIYTRIPRE